MSDMEKSTATISKIDKSAFQPAYHQLREIIRRQIANGELRPGDRIPPENDLAERYQLSRMTVRRALEKLVEDGVLVPERGRGTFVARQLLDSGTLRISDFVEDMRRRGEPAQTKLLSVNVVSASAYVAERLRIATGSKVLLVRRLLLSDEEPIGLDRKYLIYDKSAPILESELEQPSLPDLVRTRTNGMLTRASISVRASSMTAYEARFISGKQGDPVLVVEQILYLSGGRPAGYGRTVYCGAKYCLTSEINPLGISDGYPP